ncbi:MAG: oligoendopeptidase F [Eubacterium sp.]
MANKKTKTRAEIDSEFKWNLETMYATDDDWEKDLVKVGELCDKAASFQGRLTESAGTLLEALRSFDEVTMTVENVIVYASMRHDEDTTVTKYQEMYGRAMTAYTQALARLSFVTPELTSASEETIREFLAADPELQIYGFYLDKILRQKPHVLSAAEEKVAAQFEEVSGAPSNIYSMLCDADLKYGTIKYEDGEDVELTEGNYVGYLSSYDRNVRKAAFERMHGTHHEFINTITAAYDASVKADVTKARLHNFDTARQAALFEGNIPESVYDNLIDVVHQNLPKMYDYVGLRKKLLGLDELHMYDVYVPLVKLPEKEIPFNKAVETMYKALAPLGEDYISVVRQGIADRWVDVYENKNKRSGAYSGGSYTSNPFILMSYTGKLDDVLTLVHEMGHSMHSHYTRTSQPFVYGDYSIFVAEVASTVNECLTLNYLLANEKDVEMRKYIINRFIDEFKGTVFRQTMFAEFEYKAHQIVEAGGSLTAEMLSDMYDELNTLYFGGSMAHDDFIKYEWARIPHFYRAYYVYQYATGFSAAVALSQRILTEGAPAVADYKKFLSSGSSMFPVDELKIAGVDMSQKQPVIDAMEYFGKLIDELKDLTTK